MDITFWHLMLFSNSCFLTSGLILANHSFLVLERKSNPQPALNLSPLGPSHPKQNKTNKKMQPAAVSLQSSLILTPHICPDLHSHSLCKEHEAAIVKKKLVVLRYITMPGRKPMPTGVTPSGPWCQNGQGTTATQPSELPAAQKSFCYTSTICPFSLPPK
jgi:hypothetical protein